MGSTQYVKSSPLIWIANWVVDSSLDAQSILEADSFRRNQHSLNCITDKESFCLWMDPQLLRQRKISSKLAKFRESQILNVHQFSHHI